MVDQTRGPKGRCRSPEYNECYKNLTSEWNQKQQHFIPVAHASRSICIRFATVAFQSKEVFEGTPMTYFCPTLDLPLGRYGRNTLMNVRGHDRFIPTKFRKHPSCSSVVKADYVSQYILHALVHPPPSFTTINT